MTHELAASSVQPRLTTRWLGHTYRFVEQVASTNDMLKRAVADDGADSLPEGTVYVTDYQTKGRGRLGRRWEAPPGSALLLSVLLRPQWPGERLPWLTMLAGLAVAESLEAVAPVEVGLKWPNDVVLMRAGAWHKVCGLLLEGHVTPAGRVAYAILGIGINVNMTANQLPQATTPATSLRVATGRRMERRRFLLALLERLERHYTTAVAGQSPQPTWNGRLITLGRQVEVRRVGEAEALCGIAIGTDAWGRLRLRDEHGVLHTIAAGDVTLQPQ